MYEALRTELEAVQPTCDGAELLDLLALRDLFESRVSAAVGEFDRWGSWEMEGFHHPAAWIAHRARTTVREAHRLVQTARRLEQLPATRSAWESEAISGGQVAVVLAGVRRLHRELYAEHEGDLVPQIEALGVVETSRAIAHWSAHADALIEPPIDAEPERNLRASKLLGDRLVLEGDLDADRGEVVLTALRVAETSDDPGTSRTAATRRADALVDVCRYFLDNQTNKAGGRHRPHVNVIVQADDLMAARRASYEGGTALEAATAAQILCDSTFHRCVVDADGAIIDFGRATRSISAPLWSALIVRDESCRFPGCDRPPRWGEAHHVVWFSRGGTTSLDNLILLCSRHHHLLHRGEWEAKLRPDAVFEVTDPWGNVHTTSPPRTLRLE